MRPDADADLQTSVLQAGLREEARATRPYFFLLTMACVIASLGLIADSAAAIIGAMIVAPLMLPIRAAAFGALHADADLTRDAVRTVVASVVLAIAVGWLVGVVVPLPARGAEIVARTQPNLLDLGVALAAGAVSAYAKLRPAVADAVAGTAIAVALVPPLCVSGLCASNGAEAAAGGAFLLFVTNLLGIALACMVVFIAGGRAAGRQRTRRALAWTAAGCALLIVPLGLSLSRLVERARVEQTLRHLLVTRTLTVGRDVQLEGARIDWQADPPECTLKVRARELPTAVQVALVEAFVAAQLGHRFALVFDVELTTQVRAGRASAAPEMVPWSARPEGGTGP